MLLKFFRKTTRSMFARYHQFLVTNADCANWNAFEDSISRDQHLNGSRYCADSDIVWLFRSTPREGFCRTAQP